jgi:membrane protein
VSGVYNKTYGSLGMPFALLTWMWLSVFVVLFGAEINGEAERQRHQNTTVGSPLLRAHEADADKVVHDNELPNESHIAPSCTEC